MRQFWTNEKALNVDGETPNGTTNVFYRILEWIIPKIASLLSNFYANLKVGFNYQLNQ